MDRDPEIDDIGTNDAVVRRLMRSRQEDQRRIDRERRESEYQQRRHDRIYEAISGPIAHFNIANGELLARALTQAISDLFPAEPFSR